MPFYITEWLTYSLLDGAIKGTWLIGATKGTWWIGSTVPKAINSNHLCAYMPTLTRGSYCNRGIRHTYSLLSSANSIRNFSKWTWLIISTVPIVWCDSVVWWCGSMMRSNGVMRRCGSTVWFDCVMRRCGSTVYVMVWFDGVVRQSPPPTQISNKKGNIQTKVWHLYWYVE